MTKLISLEISNFKRISAAFIPIREGINKVVGQNGAGKSSVLDALASLLSGKEIPEEPVRIGTDQSVIIGHFDDMVITRKISKNGSVSLAISSKDGTVKFSKPQDFIERLTGGPNARLFDPGRFIKQGDTPDGRRAQAEQLRALVGLDFTEIDQKRASLFTQRTTANAAADEAEASHRSLPFHENATVEEVSSTSILSEIDKATEHNRTIQAKDKEITDLQTDLSGHSKKVSDQSAQIEVLKRSLAMAEASLRSLRLAGLDLDDRMAAKKVERAAMTEIDPAPARAKLTTLEADNAKVRDNKAKGRARDVAATKRATGVKLTSEIDAIDAHKAKSMQEAKFPIDGLSFDETGVRYQGKPFTQASDAEKLRIAVAIFAARKPEIRAMVIRNGSLLDQNSLTLLNELAEKFQLQVLLEIVAEKDEDNSGAIVIEDGTVKETAK